MVSCGISTPHKLSGTTSSIPSTQNICKRSESLHCPSQVRQYFGSDLHQSERGSSLQATVQLGNRNLGVVSDLQNHLGGRTPFCDSQHDSRPGVKNTRSLQLDAKPINFSGHPGAIGSTGGGSFRIPPDKTPTTVLQLATRSRCRSDRCFYSELGSEQRFCKPSLVLDQLLSMSSGSSTGKDSVVKSVVEHSVMVPSCSGNAGGSPPPSSRQREPSVPTSRSSVYIATGSFTTDHMAHLLKSFTSQGLSGEASELLLSSWTSKTNQNYNSLCSRWFTWCQSRD